ncbi:MAG: 50S ribosomal protein L15 [Acidobacteria bacterium]|nr:50S ribosomal protein L15 [Acidobacteriota bacterium]
MDLSSLRAPRGQKHAPKRLGRGMGTGHGKTSGKGHKGQRSRSGARRKRGFEGGQMPLQRRLPKRGFRNIFRKRYAIINLEQIAQLGLATITAEVLLERGIISKLYDGLKVLGDGELSGPVSVTAHRFSRSAMDKIAKAGGKAEVVAS